MGSFKCTEDGNGGAMEESKVQPFQAAPKASEEEQTKKGDSAEKAGAASAATTPTVASTEETKKEGGESGEAEPVNTSVEEVKQDP